MPSATPSSLLYLWDRRTLFIGQLSESLELSQAAATVVLGLNQGLPWSRPGACCRVARAAAIGQSRAFTGRGQPSGGLVSRPLWCSPRRPAGR